MLSAEVPSNTSSPRRSLAKLLTADSVPGVLVYLVQNAIVNDPDARLRAFSAVFSHVSALLKKDSALSDTGLGIDDLSPSTATSTRQRSPRWKWADVVMCGVTDPWSRIRSVAVQVMADLLDAEVTRVLQRQDRGNNAQINPSNSTSCDSSFMTTWNNAKKSGGEKLAATKTASLESVSSPLDYVWHRWRGTSHWYEQDGILHLLAEMYGRSGTLVGDALRTDEAGVHCLLFKVLFPALHNPQLPVRQTAGLILGVLADHRRPTSLSPIITSFVIDHLCRTIVTVPKPPRGRSPAGLFPLDSTHVLEGHLLALKELVDVEVFDVKDAGMMPLLLRLSDSPASSVRQYVAQILQPPSLWVFTHLMQQLCGHQNCLPRHPELDGDSSRSTPDGGSSENEEDYRFSWQRLETVMMALQQHHLYLLTTSETMHNLVSMDSSEKGTLTPFALTTALSVVFQATHSSRFEVARMGLQLFPLLLQLSLRFCPPAALWCICEECVGSGGCVQTELDRLSARGAVDTLAKAQTYVATFVLPTMWWFLTIRRLVAEVEGNGLSCETRAGVEEMVRPYATLDYIQLASQAHLRETVKNGAALPCAAATCGVLPLVTYFTTVMDPEEWHRCTNELLAPSWWTELLADPARQELVRVGPDFVCAVHRRGTPDEVRRVVELVPTLTASLANVPTHQQCLLLTMIRRAVMAQATGLLVEEKALPSVYHEAYVAPALIEGGDAVSLGHTWLKHFMPTPETIPTAVLWGEQLTSEGDLISLVENHEAIFETIEKRCYQELYQSPQTEPVVLRELRMLLIGLLRPGVIAPNGTHLQRYAAALAAVFGRLEKVCPQWRKMETTATCSTADASRYEAGVDESWDDWDTDEDGAAQGIYAAEEVRNATAVVSMLRERAAVWAGTNDVVATEDRFRAELAALATA